MQIYLVSGRVVNTKSGQRGVCDVVVIPPGRTHGYVRTIWGDVEFGAAASRIPALSPVHISYSTDEIGRSLAVGITYDESQ